MKRIAGFLLVLLVLAALTACEKKPVIIDEPEPQGEIQHMYALSTRHTSSWTKTITDSINMR